ncbi:TonB family protein [Labilibaculum sp. A4]|uniref:M56 family metallopeptidase n=1 Tax=Labilibaculum euxinus TaxID=2686357 RepID=UPI000F61E287|nr:M56 family metallopeptidase [Labilibaculum euxinus]MDQ1772921.1 TonB family protein [Labilibaculum euxinus]MWN75764.1 TonB family protein [Labilibaculum euxinus]
MGSMTDYLLQSSTVLILFYLIYILILRNERFFAEIRFYLLGSAFLALILPLLKFSYSITVESEFVNNAMGDVFAETITGEAIMPVKSLISKEEILLLIYLVVCTILFVRSVLKVLQIRQLMKAGEYQIVDEQKVILLDQSIPAFTFFGYIVMNREEFSDKSLNNIFAHEKVHAQQKHWIDLLFVEVLTIVLWFNPFVWLYQVAVKQTHELLADDGVIARGFNIGQYQAILMNQIMGTEVLGLANNFNYSITKKRMIMMSKEKSPLNRRYKLLIVIPVVFAVLLFNLQIVEVQAQEKKVEKVVNVTTVSGQIFNIANEPIPGVAVLVKNSNAGTISDKDGKFTILASLDAKLAFLGVDLEKFVIPVDSIIKHGDKTESGYFTKINMRTTSLMDQNEEITYKGDPIFIIVQEMPEFPGGELECRKFLARNVKYPNDAHENGVEGRVYVTFIINKSGAVDNVHIAKSVAPSLDAEAVRVIKSMPKWKPGKQRGEAVNVSYTVPINFALQNDKAVIVIEEPEKEKMDKQKYKGEDVYVIVEKMPQYPGGGEALQKHIAASVKYPQDVRQKGISGRVFVTFIVSKEGDVVQARVVRGVDPSLDAEALRVMNSIPKWTPGYEKGKAVHVSYTVPINFSLEDDKKKEVEQNRKTNLDSKIGSKKEEFIYNDEPVFVIVEEMPEYPGGALKLKEFFAGEVSKLDTNYIIGKRCFITFLVTKEGLVANAHVVRGTGDKDVDAKALEIVNSSPKWKPGKQKGQAVNVSYTVPINFGA